MKIQEILKELELNYGTFPHQAVEAAIANRERITPELLRIIEEATQNVEALFHKERYMRRDQICPLEKATQTDS